jgi:hypothetical protein
MNCRTFEHIVLELAGEKAIDAALRQEGIDHSAECPACGVRLASERWLGRGLSHLAMGNGEVVLPQALEDQLLAEFRKAKRAGSNNVSRPDFARKNYHWSMAIAAAVAAAVVAAGFMLVVRRDKGAPTSQERVAIRPTPTGSKEIEPLKPDENPVEAVQDLGSDKGSLATATPNLKGPRGVRRYAPRFIESAANTAASPQLNSDEQEFGTDFIPVSYSSAITPVESGRVVRVELPRTALASFGLPMNMAQGSDRIKADVLIDDYGTARAIRFVR